MYYLSLTVSAIGLFITFMSVFFPNGTKVLETYFGSIARARYRTLPSYNVEKVSRNPMVIIPLVIVSRTVADVGLGFDYSDITFWDLVTGLTVESLIRWFFVFITMMFVCFVLANVIYVFWFLIKYSSHTLYFIAHSFSKITLLLNPQAEVLTGTGVVVAVLGFFISLFD